MDMVEIYDCGSAVDRTTLAAVIQHESGWQSNIVGMGKNIKPVYVADVKELRKLLDVAAVEDRTIDVGLMQINSRWITSGKISIESVLDPCKNVQFGARLLVEAYERATSLGMQPADALTASLSAYNTGKFAITNAYPSLVIAAGSVVKEERSNVYDVGSGTEFDMGLKNEGERVKED